MPSSGEVVGSSELVTYFMKIGQSVSPIYGEWRKGGTRDSGDGSKGSIGVAGLEVQWGGLERRTEYRW